MLHTIRKKANLIVQILHRNYFIKQAIENKLEKKGWRERRHKQLLDDLKETRGYCILKEEALARTL
jgi:glycyl-tRNA synthetase beta subunit